MIIYCEKEKYWDSMSLYDLILDTLNEMQKYKSLFLCMVTQILSFRELKALKYSLPKTRERILLEKFNKKKKILK
jgi:hypothetical protein